MDVIPASQRPDGTWRKERRVKTGYIPQDEIPAWESRAKRFQREVASIGVVGMSKDEEPKKKAKKQQKQAPVQRAPKPSAAEEVPSFAVEEPGQKKSKKKKKKPVANSATNPTNNTNTTPVGNPTSTNKPEQLEPCPCPEIKPAEAKEHNKQAPENSLQSSSAKTEKSEPATASSASDPVKPSKPCVVKVIRLAKPVTQQPSS